MAEFSECNPDYRVVFFNRSDNALPAAGTPIKIEYERVVDDISRSTITYSVTDASCCAALGGIEPIAHAAGIYRNNKLAWYGWIDKVDYGFGDVKIRLWDGLNWLRKRAVHYDHNWVTADLAVVFQDLWDDAMAPDVISQMRVITNSTGVFENRAVQAKANRYVWNVVQEMLDSGLDVTCYGKTIIAGIISNNRPLQLRLRDVQGDPRVVKDGQLYGNRIIFDANEAAVGIYPPGPPAGNSYYPLVETIVKDAQVQDAQSAQNAARARYEFNRMVPRLVNMQDGIQLQPTSNLTVEDLIPGVLMDLDTEGLCYDQKETFRLGGVNVEVGGGVETVRMSLQPTGPLASLSDASDAVI